VARLGASEASVRRALKALKADGLVAFRGASKTGGYYATPSDDEDAGS
jgi:DNA-binding FadR family transcriptional regulator